MFTCFAASSRFPFKCLVVSASIPGKFLRHTLTGHLFCVPECVSKINKHGMGDVISKRDICSFINPLIKGANMRQSCAKAIECVLSYKRTQRIVRK